MATYKKEKLIDKIYDFRNKLAAVTQYVEHELNRTLTMFDYGDILPDSIPELELERILQTRGYCILAKDNEGKLRALWGGFAPPLDVYYRPTKVIVNNPWANINKEFIIGEDCVLIRNDPLCVGLMPKLRKYATSMTEADLTMYCSLICYRAMYMASGNDKEKESIDKFIENLEDGKLASVLSNKKFEEDENNGIKTQPFSQGGSSQLTQVIEMWQFLNGTYNNSIGLSDNVNMKRERLTEGEAEITEDVQRPFVDAMNEERNTGIEQARKLFPEDIGEGRVQFQSAWSKYNPQEKVALPQQEMETAGSIEDEEGIEPEESLNEDTEVLADDQLQEDVVPSEVTSESAEVKIEINVNSESDQAPDEEEEKEDEEDEKTEAD